MKKKQKGESGAEVMVVLGMMAYGLLKWWSSGSIF